jgi:glycosyltransferase involved in cell wall biosynthesis
MSEKKVSLVIPCYNEARGLPALIEKLGLLQDKCSELQIILVDNGSTDGTSVILQERLPSEIHLVRVAVNQGYGHGILSGLRATTTPYLGWTHADLQTDPDDFLKAWTLIQEKGAHSFVKGKRRGRSWFDVFFTVGMSVFESCFLRMGLWDINAQPTLFHRDFFLLWGHPPLDFSLDLYAYAMAKKKRYKVYRFSVWFRKRIFGHSSWNHGLSSKWRFIRRTVTFSYGLRVHLNEK